jgi:hypothetical protein
MEKTWQTRGPQKRCQCCRAQCRSPSIGQERNCCTDAWILLRYNTSLTQFSIVSHNHIGLIKERTILRPLNPNSLLGLQTTCMRLVSQSPWGLFSPTELTDKAERNLEFSLSSGPISVSAYISSEMKCSPCFWHKSMQPRITSLG